MTHEPELLRAIADRPDEDGAREVYADWLDESGRPALALAVRLGLQLARGDDDGAPDYALWARAANALRAAVDAHPDAFPLRTLRDASARLTVRRGLPWRLDCQGLDPDARDHYPALAAALPTVRRVALQQHERQRLRKDVRAIDRGWPRLQGLELRAISAFPHECQRRAPVWGLSVDGVRRQTAWIADSPQLRWVAVTPGRGRTAATTLRPLTTLWHLERLQLVCHQEHTLPDGWTAPPSLRQLTYVAWDGARGPSPDVLDGLPDLRALALELDNDPTGDAPLIDALARSPVRWLRLDWSVHLDDPALAALPDALGAAPALEGLALRSTWTDEDDDPGPRFQACVEAARPHALAAHAVDVAGLPDAALDRLRYLLIGDGVVDDALVDRLLDAPLAYLGLADVDIEHDALRRLVDHPSLHVLASRSGRLSFDDPWAGLPPAPREDLFVDVGASVALAPPPGLPEL